MKEQVEVNGKIFKVGDTIKKRDSVCRKIMYIANSNYFFSIGEYEYIESINTLKNWSVKKPERETITMYEYICDYGVIKFLTKDKRLISTDIIGDLRLEYCSDKAHLIPNYRTYKVYADTLEPVDNLEEE